MANLSIISACNRSCDYCFARDAYEPAQTAGGQMSGDQMSSDQMSSDQMSSDQMSPEVFGQALDFLERSGIDQARLLGGEPTLHPQFEQLVQRVMARGLNLMIFTNGQMPESARRCLAQTPVERTRILINLTSGKPSGQWTADRHQKETMVALGPRITPGVNIYQPDMVFDGVLDMIRRYHLQPSVRLGLAQPLISQSNRYLLPREYQRTGHGLIRFARAATEQGVSLEFDCGFVPCMFPPEGQDILAEAAATIGRRCNPILDVLPDGTVSSCYPLTALGTLPLPLTRTADQLRGQFEKQWEVYRQIGVFRDCGSCPWFESRRCHGGCLAAAMTRLRPGQPGRDLSWNEDAEFTDASLISVSSDKSHEEGISRTSQKTRRWVLPFINQPAEFWQELATTHGRHIREVYFPLSLDGVGSGRPSQPQAHLEAFLDGAPLKAAVLINPMILPKPIDQLTPAIIRELRNLCDRYDIHGVTVTNPDLGRSIRVQLPHLALTASVLMDIHTPHQVAMIGDTFDHLVPASRVMRDTRALKHLRQAFGGRIRLMVNEACLPGCPYRAQHFYEMGQDIPHPRSLCDDLLTGTPWLRLTGAWVLPQHLDLYEGLYDDLKLAGRVTLKNPLDYMRVLDAYLHRRPLTPDAIGGGPASMLTPLPIDRNFYARTLDCKHQCHQCDHCRQYYRKGKTDGI